MRTSVPLPPSPSDHNSIEARAHDEDKRAVHALNVVHGPDVVTDHQLVRRQVGLHKEGDH